MVLLHMRAEFRNMFYNYTEFRSRSPRLNAHRTIGVFGRLVSKLAPARGKPLIGAVRLPAASMISG